MRSVDRPFVSLDRNHEFVLLHFLRPTKLFLNVADYDDDDDADDDADDDHGIAPMLVIRGIGNE